MSRRPGSSRHLREKERDASSGGRTARSSFFFLVSSRFRTGSPWSAGQRAALALFTPLVRSRKSDAGCNRGTKTSTEPARQRIRIAEEADSSIPARVTSRSPDEFVLVWKKAFREPRLKELNYDADLHSSSSDATADNDQ